jgi:hypothetical protein
MYSIFLTVCGIIVCWGFVELSWVIFVNIFRAIDNFLQDRRINKLRREFVNNPVEFIDKNNNVTWVYNKKGNRDV